MSRSSLNLVYFYAHVAMQYEFCWSVEHDMTQSH